MRTLKKEYKELKKQISRDCNILYYNKDAYNNKELNCKVHYGSLYDLYQNFIPNKTFTILFRKINNNRYMYLTYTTKEVVVYE